MSLRLIRELNEGVSTLHEGTATDGKKYYFIEGVYMQSEVRNRNGRVYPRNVMESALNRYIEEKMSNQTAYGELGHPANPTINPERISHLIEKLEFDGNDVMGRAKILDTTYGITAQKILEGGGRLGVSSRGLGSLKQTNSVMEVQSDFYISTAADIVTDPSAPKAFVNAILEDVEWIYNQGIWSSQKIEEAKCARDDAFSSKDREIREKKLMMLFTTFIDSLNKKLDKGK